MIISIEGIIGAGKTTLGLALRDEIALDGHDVTFVQEPTPKDSPWLERYYRDQKRWAFHAQISMLLSRLRSYRMATRGNENTIIIMDRSVFSDRSFAHAQMSMGFMSDVEIDLYNQAYTTLIDEVSFDLILHMNTSIEDAMDAVCLRARTQGEVDGVTEEYQRSLREGIHRSLEETLTPIVRPARLEKWSQQYRDQVTQLSHLICTRHEVARQGG